MNPLAEFLSGLPDPGTGKLPMHLEVVPMASERVADVALLLGLIGLFWSLGHLFKSAGLPGLRPFVFASGLTGILMLFFTNTAFWMVKGLEVDDSRLTLLMHIGDDKTLAWSDIKSVSFDDGSLFPVFSDDASLVLAGSDGRTIAVPRFIPDVARAVRLVAHHLQPAPDGRTSSP